MQAGDVLHILHVGTKVAACEINGRKYIEFEFSSLEELK